METEHIVLLEQQEQQQQSQQQLLDQESKEQPKKLTDEQRQANALNLQEKIAKFKFESQMEELKNLGFKNEQFMFRSLRMHNGNTLSAAKFLKSIQTGSRAEKLAKFDLLQAELKEEREAKILARQQRLLKQQQNQQEKKKKSEENKENPFAKLSQEEKQAIRKSKREENAKKRMEEQFPSFSAFNERMIAQGFTETQMNFQALKKEQGNEEKAAQRLRIKHHMKSLELCTTLKQSQFSKIYVDCNNCVYLEQKFIARALNGNFTFIEEMIASLLRLFQQKYEVDGASDSTTISLVFDRSKLLTEAQQKAKLFLSEKFEILSARPEFETVGDLLTSIAAKEKTNERVLYVTSDRYLQARLSEATAKNIMGSKIFFNKIKKDFVGKREYEALLDV